MRPRRRARPQHRLLRPARRGRGHLSVRRARLRFGGDPAGLAAAQGRLCEGDRLDAAGVILLALDTCLDACSVAVWADGRVLAGSSEPMRRGHQERLAVMAQATMAQAGTAFSALDRIGVTLGPGSFTGLRVGLAFAKGLGLALGRPVVGVGVLEAQAQGAGAGFVAAAVDARRGQVYLQAFDGGRALMAPDVLPVETAGTRLAELWTGGPAT